MEIIKLGNPILRQVSEEVKLPLSKEDRALMTSMYTFLKANSRLAVGISAVQIGVLKRMCAINYRGNAGMVSYQLVNPKITWHSQKTYCLLGGEGCLSVNEYHNNLIPRWAMINVSAYDCIRNKTITIRASGLEAVVLQHEIDHMDGILYIDYIK